jgi:transcriptional regulator with XRE-family HTH domain
MKSVRRPLTDLENQYRENLNRIWKNKKTELKLTQDTLAKRAGWNTQTVFSQYLRGKMALNVTAVLRIAKELEVNPTEIMPDIADILPEVSNHLTQLTPKQKKAYHLAEQIMNLPEEQIDAILSLPAIIKTIKKLRT